jgi:isoquinoline 1-oxidoreductase beta subunit
MGLERSLNPTEARAESAAEGAMSRRTFLKASAAAGGGLLLSFSLPALRRLAEAAGPSTANTFAPTLHPHRPRRPRDADRAQGGDGSGVYTSMPMLIAEELEVGLDQVHLHLRRPTTRCTAIRSSSITR